MAYERTHSAASRRGPVDRSVIQTESAQILKELKRHTHYTPHKPHNKTLQERIELSIIRNRTPSRTASGLASLQETKQPLMKRGAGIDSNDTLSEGAVNNTKYYARFVEEYSERPTNQIEINFTKMIHGNSLVEDNHHYASVPSNVNDSIMEGGLIEKRNSKIMSANCTSINAACSNYSIH